MSLLTLSDVKISYGGIQAVKGIGASRKRRGPVYGDPIGRVAEGCPEVDQ
jgi:hypothetical protein